MCGTAEMLHLSANVCTCGMCLSGRDAPSFPMCVCLTGRDDAPSFGQCVYILSDQDARPMCKHVVCVCQDYPSFGQCVS